jgi:hypothetical protein
MSCALVSKKALVQVGFLDASLPSCQDWDLFIRLREHGKISFVQEELVEFWHHKGDRISRDKQSVHLSHDERHHFDCNLRPVVRISSAWNDDPGYAITLRGTAVSYGGGHVVRTTRRRNRLMGQDAAKSIRSLVPTDPAEVFSWKIQSLLGATSRPYLAAKQPCQRSRKPEARS